MKKSLSKIIKNGKEAITVEFGIQENDRFSITAMIGEKHSGRYRDPMTVENKKFDLYACGCQHEEVLKYWPDMTDIIKLHLSDKNGEPLYAVENGFYHITKDFDTGVRYLRLSEADKNRLVDEVLKSSGDTKPERQTTKGRFIDFIDSMRPVWKAEADEVIKKYGLSIPELV